MKENLRDIRVGVINPNTQNLAGLKTGV